MTAHSNEAEQLSIEALIEAVLFVSSEPVTINQMSEALDRKSSEIEAGLKALNLSLINRGLKLQNNAGRYQLTSDPGAAVQIEKFLGLEATAKLSRAAIETMTIVAYRQPITRPAIDAIRGVSSDGVLRSLLQKGLVEEQGRAEGPGRPILYGITVDFLQHFGISSLDELPPFELLESPVEPNGILKE
ncbi:MAG: SMC-Scp complex subunit ScpB [Anaerolineae bacterium]|jgi:segregation and condensation protein B|nr:SMC-Scp complex subunit ScpB [Anaerolineae bacterium]